MLVIFECLELTRAFAGTHVCDCGVIWRLMVLGVEQQRAGARVFCEGGGRVGEPFWEDGFEFCLFVMRFCDAL